MSNKINNLCLKTVIEIEGTAVDGGENEKIVVDFTDRKFANKVLKLMQRCRNIGDEVREKFEKADKVEDELDKMLLFSDIELEVLEEVKDKLNNAFGFSITDKIFGEGCVPDLDRYLEFFELLSPYVQAAFKAEKDRVESVKSRYGLERISVKAGG